MPVNLQSQNLDSIYLRVDFTVNQLARDGDKLYIGGDFFRTTYNTGCAALMTTELAFPDPYFPNLTLKSGGGALAVISDGAGGWYIGGGFDVTAGGETYNNLVHVLSDNSIDAGFRPEPDANVWALALDGNTLYVGGAFTTIDGQSISRLVKLNAETGTVDLTWNPAPNNRVNALAIDGDYLDVGGDFTEIGGFQQRYFARLDKTTGSVLYTVSFFTGVDELNHTPGGIYAGGNFGGGGFYSGSAAVVTTASATPTERIPFFTGNVNTVISDGSGGWYAGGDFTTESGGQTFSRLVHINADHSLDTGFKPDPNAEVNALLLDGAVLYVGGDFTTIGGQSLDRLVKMNAQTGVVDMTWTPNPTQAVRALSMNATNLYVGGSFLQISGMSTQFLAEFNKSTGNLTSFDPAINGTVNTLELTATEIYVGGTFTFVGADSRNRIAAIDLATADATSFNPNANGAVTALELDPATMTLYVGGDFFAIGGQSRTRLAAFDSLGNVNGWNVSSSSTVNDLLIDGSLIYICSEGSISFGGASRGHVGAADKATGTLSGWEPGPRFGFGSVKTIAISGGDVFIGGGFDWLDYKIIGKLAKIRKSDYRLEPAFSPAPNGFIEAIEVADDTLYVGGSFTTIDGQTRNRVAALDTMGNVNNWNPNSNSNVQEILAVGDTVYILGGFTTMGGESRLYTASVHKTTGALTNWDPRPNGTAYSIASNGQDLCLGGFIQRFNDNNNTVSDVVQYDIPTKQVTDWNPMVNGEVESVLVRGDTVYLGGHFTQAGGETRVGFAAVNTTTGDVYPVTADLNTGGVVYNMESKSDTLYLGGTFNQVAGQSRNNAAAINRLNGSLLTWDPGPNARVWDIEDSNGDVFLGGEFTQIGGAARNRIAAVDKNTGTASGWDPGANNTVRSLAVSDDRVYAGGQFFQIGGQSRWGVAALDRNTGTALSWDPDLNNYDIYAVELNGNTVMVGGSFSQIGGEDYSFFGYLDDSTAMPKVWFPEFNSTVRQIEADEGSVLFSGSFFEVNGEPLDGFAVLTPPIEIKAGISCGMFNAQVCIDVTAENFTNMKTMQYSMHFDPNAITFNSIQNINLPATFSPNTSQAASGNLTFSWTDNSGQGASLPNGTVLYQLCFDLTGAPGSTTDITIDGNLLALEFTNNSDQDLEKVLTPGLIAITLGNLNVWTGGGDGVLWSDSSNWCLGVPVVSDSVLINSGTVQLNVQPVMSALVVNGGELEVVGGNTYNVNAPFTIGSEAVLDIFDGTLDVNDTLENNGTIEGFGTIDLLDAVVTKYGRWAPGNSAGRTRVRGTHSNESSGMEVGFFDGIVQQDRLEVTQSINLGGLLELSQLPGTLPAGTYTLIVCEGGANCRTGNFDLISYFPACGGNCTIEYTDTSANLVVAAPLLFTCSWLGGTGNWNDATRWDCGEIPTEDGNVIIDSGEVIVDAPITVNGLTLNGGTLSGTGNLTTSQFFALNGGNFALAGRHTMSNMSLSNSPTISKGTLTLNGTNTWTNPDLTLGGNTRLRLSSTDTLNLVADQPGSIALSGSGSPVFTAFGTVVKSGTLTMSIDVPFQLYGDKLDVSEGILDLNSEFSYTGTVKGNGTIDLTDATVNGLEGGNFSPGASPGTLEVLGNYKNRTLNMEIVENGGNTTKDSLSVSGNVDLAGSTLNVTFMGNVPPGGYELLSFGSNASQTQFGEVNLPPACADCFLVYGSNKITLGSCDLPVVNAPGITQPDCATQVGTIEVNATGSGTLEYSIDGGINWQASNTFSGLSPGNYDIKVRLQSSTACAIAYGMNPVVLESPTGCVIPGCASSLDVDGNDDGVNFGNSLGNFGTNDFTVEAYIKTAGADQYVLSKRGVCNLANFWTIRVNADGQLDVEMCESASGPFNLITSTSNIADGNWHHFAVTRQGGTVKIYIDGSEEASEPTPYNISNSADLLIGPHVCSAFNGIYAGKIDELRFWNDARSVTEIQNNKDVELTGSEAGLEAYYKFNQGTPGGNNAGQTTLTDVTPNSFDGTMTNFALTGNSSNWISDNWSGGTLDFGGTMDYVSVGDLGSVTDWTIETWFKPVGETNYENVFHSDDLGNNNGVRLEISEDFSAGHLYANVSGSNVVTFHTIVPLSSSLPLVWNHVAIVGDKTNNKLRIYFNGEEVINTAHTDWPAGFPDFVLGRGFSNSADRDFKGQMDEFRVWNYARTQSEVLVQKDVKIAGNEPGLIAYYRFNQGAPNGNNSTVTTLDDASTGNANGTLNNFALTGTTSNWTASGAPLDCCPEVLQVSDDPIDSGGYSALNELNSTGKVPATNHVVFGAKNGVGLNGDFEVVQGAVFEVLLKGCMP